MSPVFGPSYARAYDVLYGDKDYRAEVRLIARLLRAYGRRQPRSILDLGCGTGGHAIPLARAGYDVVGVDRSADMLARAREKAAVLPAGCKAEFREGDIRGVDLGRRFDAVLMMFAVLGYQRGNADVLSALDAARRHLRPGGVLLFDVWHGPAVLRQRPSRRVKRVDAPDGRIERTASPELDVRRHLCTVRYVLARRSAGRAARLAAESHRVRYFFPLELELFLACAGMELVRIGSFPDFRRAPGDATWNVLCVARPARGVTGRTRRRT